MKNKEETYQESNAEEIVLRYETALQEGKCEYFDVDDIEVLVDYYMVKNQNTKAQSAIEYGLFIHPNNTEFKVIKAKIALYSNRIDEAVEILEKLLVIEPNNLELRIVKILCLIYTGNESKADKLIAELNGEEDAFAHEIGYAYYETSNYEKAIVYLEKKVKLSPENGNDKWDTLCDIAFCFLQMGEDEKAIAIYNQLLDIDPYAKDIWFALGTTYIACQDYEKAIDALDYAYVISEDYQALLQKAHVLYQSNKLQCALESYQEYAEANQRPPFVLVYIGECYEKIGEIQRAMDYYTEAYEKDNQNVEALCGLCICLLEMDLNEKALMYIDLALKIEPSLPEAWVYKAECYLNLGDRTTAMRCYKKAVSLNPYMSDVFYTIGNLYFDQDNIKKTLEYYEKGIRVAQHDNEDMYIYFAIVYYKANSLNKAYYYLSKAIEINPAESRKMFLSFFPYLSLSDDFAKLIDTDKETCINGIDNEEEN